MRQTHQHLPNRCRPAVYAFSLIELLVVLAIVSMLAAFILHAAGGAIAKGRSITCVSNLRQLHMLTEGYVSDNEKYPLMAQQVEDDDGIIRNIPDESFYTHFGDESVTACPEAKFKGKNHAGKPIKSYGSNPMMMNYSRADSARPAVRPNQVTRPLEIVLLADSPQFASGAIRVLPYSMAWWPHPLNGDETRENEPLTEAIIPATGFWDDIPLMPRRHQRRANLVFVDGHTSSIGAPSDLLERNYYWNY